MIEHRGLVNLVPAQIQALRLNQNSSALQFASFSFDASVFEIFPALCAGASLYLRRPEDQADAASLQHLLDSGLTHATLPSAVLATLPEGATLGSLQTLVVAGDVLPPSLANQWMQGRRLINAYGPTEATVCATMHLCRDAHTSPVPVGKPIVNTKIYILDPQGEPVPTGVAGEIYISGAGVARGYLNRPELSAGHFLKDPFVAQPVARMYRTGDLGRWLPDGNIEFLGRNDFQVKLRGFRIELGEIETRLAQHPAVREAVVLVRRDQLVAYLIPVHAERIPGAAALRSHLRVTLPDYMIPAAYISLDALPLTPNCKLDRHALPAPGSDAYSTKVYEEPQGALELLLARIWTDLLHVERVGRRDNFFELGGNSLLAVRMVRQLEQQGRHLSIAQLFAEPTIAALSQHCSNRDALSARAHSALLIRTGVDQINLFMTPDGTGSLLYANVLASQLDPRLTVYGLPLRASKHTSGITIQSQAGHLCQMVRDKQHHGPYHLAGWSFGGLLAYEIAAQLISLGEEVRSLTLIDTAHPALLRQMQEGALTGDDPQALLLEYVMDQVSSGWRKDQPVLGALLNSNQFDFESLVQFCRAEQVLPARFLYYSTSQIYEQLTCEQLHYKSSIRYNPPHLPISVNLFAAEDTPFTSSSLGRDVVFGNTQLHTKLMSGDHYSMFRPPNLRALAQALSDAVTRAVAAREFVTHYHSDRNHQGFQNRIIQKS
jgi:thioesterase domain-containing protein/aryl carrier-like protein